MKNTQNSPNLSKQFQNKSEIESTPKKNQVKIQKKKNKGFKFFKY